MVKSTQIMQNWPDQAREAAQLVIDKYGEPDESCESMLVWHNPGPWKRMIAYGDFDNHNFPAPHIDAVESFLNLNVPTDKVCKLFEFDGSVVVNRTRGEISARCHDEEANFLALNLASDIIEGKKSAQEARDYYAKEFLDYRRGKPTPYMEGLKFSSLGAADPDERLISDEELGQAKKEGQK
jgi:hypothetical protein